MFLFSSLFHIRSCQQSLLESSNMRVIALVSLALTLAAESLPLFTRADGSTFTVGASYMLSFPGGSLTDPVSLSLDANYPPTISATYTGHDATLFTLRPITGDASHLDSEVDSVVGGTDLTSNPATDDGTLGSRATIDSESGDLVDKVAGAVVGQDNGSGDVVSGSEDLTTEALP